MSPAATLYPLFDTPPLRGPHRTSRLILSWLLFTSVTALPTTSTLSEYHRRSSATATGGVSRKTSRTTLTGFGLMLSLDAICPTTSLVHQLLVSLIVISPICESRPRNPLRPTMSPFQ